MAEKNKKHSIATFIALSVIGVASSFVFVFTAFAAGMVPDDVIALVNNSRTKATLSPLSANAKLTAAAKNKADDMIKNDYFAHTSPKGIEPWYWIKQAGYQYKAAGENLAINYTDAKEQHEAWMKSETHRANIMSTRYQEIGVAVVKGKIDGKESTVTVEMFGAPLVAVADQMAPVPPVAVPAPVAIKGVETEGTAPLPEDLVKEAETVMPEKQVIPIAPLRPALNSFVPDTKWLSFVFALLLLATLLITPTLFVVRAYRLLLRKSPKEVAVTTKVGTLEPTTLSVDGIHKMLAH